MELKIIYEDKNLLVIDKKAGITVFSEEYKREKTIIEYLLEKYPLLEKVGFAPRYGVIHRLDKETSGIVLIAKNKKTLDFLQNQFKEKKVIKKYIALTIGKIRQKKGEIETLIGRDLKNRKKQKAFLIHSPDSKKKGKRKAKTYYKVLRLYSNKKQKFTLLELIPETGRKHQIRVHLSFLGHPIAGDKIYSFKQKNNLRNLKRQFLHASYLKIRDVYEKEKEFTSELPSDLKNIIKSLKQISYD